MWVLDAGLLTLNARCITKGMLKSRLTSCLLLIANNLLNQVICTRILTHSLVFWTQMRKENLYRKKTSHVSVFAAFIYPCPYWGQSILDSKLIYCVEPSVGSNMGGT